MMVIVRGATSNPTVTPMVAREFMISANGDQTGEVERRVAEEKVIGAHHGFGTANTIDKATTITKARVMYAMEPGSGLRGGIPATVAAAAVAGDPSGGKIPPRLMPMREAPWRNLVEARQNA